jgi:hypothetical protein
LLDFTVTIATTGRPSFEFFRKAAKKNIFVHYRSHMPSRVKLSIIRNERQRIRERCTEAATRRVHEHAFDTLLRRHGYPAPMIQQSRASQTPTPCSSSRTTGRGFFYLKLPFLSDTVNHKLKRIFLSEGINIRLAQRGFSLRDALKHRRESLPCHLRDCPLESALCMRKNIVYELKCSVCSATYIGSTIRALHVRVREHITRSVSSVFQHLRRCNTNRFETTIIASDPDEANLRLREAMLIRQHCPSINSRAESEELAGFLFI